MRRNEPDCGGAGLFCPRCGEPLHTYDTLYCFEGRAVACEFCFWERLFFWRRDCGRPAGESAHLCLGGGIRG